MEHSNGKITRRHSRQKSGQRSDPKGERFFLQGKRWRFPRNLAPYEVEARVARLRALWEDHERFWRNRFFIDPHAYSPASEDLLEFKAAAYRRQQHGSDGASAPSAISWTPLVLWIAEQINHGVKPLVLPPLSVIVQSIFHDDLVDYRFGYIARLFCGPQETHPVSTDHLHWNDALKLQDILTQAYPSIPWVMPGPTARGGLIDLCRSGVSDRSRQANLGSESVRREQGSHGVHD